MKKDNERAEVASDGPSSKLLLGRWVAIDITLSLQASDTPLVIDSIELECSSGTGNGVQGGVLSLFCSFDLLFYYTP